MKLLEKLLDKESLFETFLENNKSNLEQLDELSGALETLPLFFSDLMKTVENEKFLKETKLSPEMFNTNYDPTAKFDFNQRVRVFKRACIKSSHAKCCFDV